MRYSYEEQLQNIFSNDGQRIFFKIAVRVMEMLRDTGAVTMEKATEGQPSIAGKWFHMACLDHMVVIGLIREVTGTDVPQQFRIFVRKET